MIRKSQDITSVVFSVRVYQLLLNAYPTKFQQEYGSHMLHVFEDCCLRAARQSGANGMLKWWAVTLLDLIQSVISEHTQKETTMDTRQSDIVRALSEAVNLMIDTVSSGQFGFDYAASKYAKQAHGELALAFQDYWQAIETGFESLRDPSTDARPNLEDVRRDALLALADRINVPKVTTFVQGMIEAQDAHSDVREALRSQAERLKNA
jgi:hypothetical protein